MEDIFTKAVSRRAFLGGTLAAGGLLLTGCGGSSKSPNTNPSGGAQPSGSTPAAGGNLAKNLRIGVATDLLLAGVLRYQASNQPLRRTVFDYLLDKNTDGSYRPALAKSWEWSADKKTLIFTLRDGVTFHTGRAFGPDDVIATTQAALTKGSGSQAASLLKYATGMKKTGTNQVTVTFDSPFPAYLDAFAMLPIIDSQTYASIADGKQVIGTGPYKFQSWTPGSKYAMVKNPSYWQEGKPYFESLAFSVITDSQALLAAMQSGTLDMVDGMVTRDAVTLKKTSKFTVTPSASYDIYVGANTKIKPLDDVRVRQAIAYGLDRDRIASQVYNGLAEASCIPWADNTPGISKSEITHYAYNVEKAKSLLQQAGASGAEVSLSAFPQDPAAGAIADIVQYGLTQIGLKVKPVSYDSATFAKHIQGGDFPGLWVTNVALTAMGPVTALLTANPLTTAKNTENFVNDQYTKLVNAAVTASQDQQAAANTALTDYLLEQAFHNTVVQGSTPVVGVNGLTGVTTDLTLAVDLTNAKLTT